MKASYPDSFKKLLDNFKESAPNNYIGQGNPGANILIVGKECTTPVKTDEQKYPGEKDFYTIETKMNFETWRNNVYRNIDFDDVPDWETSPLHFHEKYNPLFPYNSHRVGWSKTWDGYQNFINHLLPANMVAKSGQHYNFWQYSFITELSTNNMNYSRKNNLTADSVNTRLNGIFQQDFFQQFPVIIFAVFRYYDWYKIDIEKCFNQKHIGPPVLDKHNGRIPEFIHKHINFSPDGHPRLLLHTNHFAMRSNEFIAAVAKECKMFMDEYGISILASVK